MAFICGVSTTRGLQVPGRVVDDLVQVARRLEIELGELLQPVIHLACGQLAGVEALLEGGRGSGVVALLGVDEAVGLVDLELLESRLAGDCVGGLELRQRLGVLALLAQCQRLAQRITNLLAHLCLLGKRGGRGQQATDGQAGATASEMMSRRLLEHLSDPSLETATAGPRRSTRAAPAGHTPGS